MTGRTKNYFIDLEKLQNVAVDETELIDDYGPRILYIALRRLRDRTLAEEVAQETLTLVIQALREDRIREEAKLPGYIFTVANNLILKALRERSRKEELDSKPEPEGQDAWVDDHDAGLLIEEERKQVRHALAQLDSSDYDLLNEIFVHEKSLEEISKELGISNAALRKRKSRALERLKKLFLGESQNR